MRVGVMTNTDDQSDLDRRLRVEAALRESESRFHLLADSIPQLA
jgi:PAS domain-containing protein